MRGLIFSLFFFVFSALTAQDEVPKAKIYSTHLKFSNETRFIRAGLLYDVKDSSILVSPEMLNEPFLFDNPALKEFYFFDIESIRLGYKKRVVKGLLYGALAGFATGFIAGLSDGDTRIFSSHVVISRNEKALAGGLFLGGAGAAIGSGIGFISTIKIPINGNFENFNTNKSRLKNYSFKK